MPFRHFVSAVVNSRSWFRATTLVGVIVLSLTGCTTPDTISKFCSSAAATMTSAKPVFNDMKQSCLREVQSRESFATFKLPIQQDKDCDDIGKQADGAVAAVQVLAEYFTAINSLASFGTTKIGGDAQTL